MLDPYWTYTALILDLYCIYPGPILDLYGMCIYVYICLQMYKNIKMKLVVMMYVGIERHVLNVYSIIMLYAPHDERHGPAGCFWCPREMTGSKTRFRALATLCIPEVGDIDYHHI